MDTKTALADQLNQLLGGIGAHGDFESAVADLPAELCVRSHGGLSHTPWRLVEHLRIAQRDILDFSRSSDHRSPPWPDGYWFGGDAPPTADAWDSIVEQFSRDLTAMQDLVSAPSADLFAPISWGDGPMILREALLVAGHMRTTSDKLVTLRRLLGAWSET